MKIISNGSKWEGEVPDGVDKLIELLSSSPLDPGFESCGNFCRFEGGIFTVFGNFFFISHVFQIEGTLPELLPVMKAIKINKRSSEYRELRPLRA